MPLAFTQEDFLVNSQLAHYLDLHLLKVTHLNVIHDNVYILNVKSISESVLTCL